MEIEKQICSLELAKRLKDFGVKQESYFVWAVQDDEAILTRDDGTLDDADGIEDYSAFTVAELGEMLPEIINGFELLIERESEWKIRYVEWGNDGPETRFLLFPDLKEADARAKMLIYLIEKKLVTP